MARVKRGVTAHARHKKILKLAKGYRGRGSTCYRVAKEKANLHIKSLLPDLDKGTFFAVKEALKRVMPEQYAYLKELKDILLEKNSTKYL